MTRYTPPIRRIPTSYGHYYKDGSGQRIPGVTTIINGGTPKQDLIEWAGNKSAEIAVDNWEHLSDLKPLARLEYIRRARKTSDNLVKNRGTRVHALAEQVVRGDQAEFETLDEEQLLRPYIENYVRFIDLWELDPVLVETVVVHYGSDNPAGVSGYAGTLDLIADITNPYTSERERWLLDLKTGEKGIWAEAALQMSAYRRAQYYVDTDGAEQPMVPIDTDRCGAVHVTADDAALIPVLADDETFKVFRHAQKMYEFAKDKDPYVRPELKHTRRSTVKITWEEPA